MRLSVSVLASQKESTGNTLEFSGSRSGPYFDKVASKNVTALLGKTAYLNCRVKNLGNKTVSTLSDRIRYTNNKGRYAAAVTHTISASSDLASDEGGTDREIAISILNVFVFQFIYICKIVSTRFLFDT